ncbi:molybdopterin-dependent oxidoreductase, partial [Salmonella enterica subsp. enterica serovar Kentucky]|nr:molybdopterin-dependent oxidoreductase [Salmonella enterica subsp. enterica serovar Kentucky]
FERISWDEALDTIADNLKRIIANYGNEAVHVIYATGVAGGNISRGARFRSFVRVFEVRWVGIICCAVEAEHGLGWYASSCFRAA